VRKGLRSEKGTEGEGKRETKRVKEGRRENLRD
jgi:hypothetical protein